MQGAARGLPHKGRQAGSKAVRGSPWPGHQPTGTEGQAKESHQQGKARTGKARDWAWRTCSVAQPRTRGQIMSSGVALESNGVANGGSRWGFLTSFSQLSCFHRSLQHKLHCGKVDPKDCDRRGEKLHRNTEEEGAYRLVKAN